MNTSKYIELHTENIEAFIVPIEKIVKLSFRPLKSRFELANGRFVKDSSYDNYITDIVFSIKDSDKVMKVKHPESSGDITEIDITQRTDYTHLVLYDRGKETKYTIQWFGNDEYENEGATWRNLNYLNDFSSSEQEVREWIFTSDINNYGKFLTSNIDK